MTTAPKISIVLPVYNGERFLARAIESCLAQTMRSFELIIVDDCSDDGTARIIRDYAARDSRIIRMRNAANQNLPNTLNIGFARARGEYLTWTSDDNEYYPAALATLAAELDADAAIGLVFSNFIIIYADNNKPPKLANIHRSHPERRMPHTDTAGACFLYRASLAAQTHGYDDHWRIVEDYEFFLRLYLLAEFKYVDQVLYQYRWHDNSLSNTAPHDYRQHRTGRAQIHHIQAIKNHPKISRRVLSATFYKIAKRMRTCPHCRHLAGFYLKEAIKAYPLILLRAVEKRIWYY